MVKYEEISKEIDDALSSLPLIPAASFMRAFGLAEAVSKMEDIFDHPLVKKTVLAMQDNPLGFLTDRAAKGEPYGYEIVKPAVIQALIEGYLITGNEFNIIMSRYMPVKAGKFRLINEHPGISNFNPTTTSATYFFEERGGWNNKKEMVEVAKVQCYATWNLDGKKCSIGYDDDKLVFKIKVNKGMGDDGIVGKALSKLYGRVLTRLIGVSIPEVDDIQDGIVSEKDVPENLKSANPEPEKIKDPDLPKKNPRNPDEDMHFGKGIAPETEHEPPGAPETHPKAFVPPKVCGHTKCAAYTDTLASHCDNPGFHDKDKPGKVCFLFENSVSPECHDTEFCVVGINNLLASLPKEKREEAKKDLGIEKAVLAIDKWRMYYWIYGAEFPEGVTV